jgi:GAF domain-containing protein
MFFASSEPMLSSALCSNLFDALAVAKSADAALRQIDAYRGLFAGPGIFSIQLNVTTADDPAGEIRLQRFYSSSADRFPVDGKKRKTLTPWTEALFARREVVVSEGADALGRHFDDHEQLRQLGLQRAINVPLLRGGVTYATFNVFGTRAHWQDDEIVTMRLLALLAAQWVQPAAGLSYSLGAAAKAAAAPAGR